MSEINTEKIKDEQQNKVNVKGGRFSGRKWFFKFPYKTYETDVEFNDGFMQCKQGSGFIRIQSRVPFKLEYDNIYAVDVKKKYSIPNTVAAIFFIILAIAIETWIAIPLALLLLWIGKTCVVIIHNQNGKYEIPVEFMTEAEDLRNRIAAAQSQAMRK